VPPKARGTPSKRGLSSPSAGLALDALDALLAGAARGPVGVHGDPVVVPHHTSPRG
jgi:hypothetical protein